MAESHGQNYLTKLLKLIGAEGYVNWNRRVRICIQQPDIDVLGLSKWPDQGIFAQLRKWVEANVKAKTKVTLTLFDGPSSQLSAFVDDVKKLLKNPGPIWKTFTKWQKSKWPLTFDTNQSSWFQKDDEWDKHIGAFQFLVAKISFND